MEEKRYKDGLELSDMMFSVDFLFSKLLHRKIFFKNTISTKMNEEHKSNFKTDGKRGT